MSDDKTEATEGSESAVERVVMWVRTLLLKRKAKSHYLSYCALRDRYDCGNHMIDEITGGKLGHHRNMFNLVMDQLACIDKTTPDSRL